MKKRLAGSGFSLVEVLIAMTLLFLVLFIGSYAYGLYARYWQTELGDFSSQMRSLKGVTALHSVIRNMRPYLLKGGASGAYYYFEGGKSVIRLVTKNSVSAPNFPAVVEIKASLDENSKTDLWYREYVMKDKPILNEADFGQFGEPISLLQDFDDITFEFYGYASYLDWINKERQGLDAAQAWFGFYSGQDTLIPPNVVKMKLTNEEGSYELMIPLASFYSNQLESYMLGNDNL